MYIDPGFSKVSFRTLLYQCDDERNKKMGSEGYQTSGYLFDYFHDAFDMLYSQVQKKFEVCVILPYLWNIFQGT